MLWKIELDPEIEGLYHNPRPPEQLPVPNAELNTEFFAYESNKETSKNESFADDANNFILLNENSILKLKIILDNFRSLSGLQCNIDKLYAMRIGDTDGEIDQAILDVGFPFCNELTVLGFVINNTGTFITKNFDKVRQKINSLIRFWERFNLSLPGKITIYKTLLLPQLNFIASVLPPPAETLLELEKIMENFVIKGFGVAKDRLYQPVKESK